MLKCREISLQASDYLDQQLPPRRRLAFAFHLLLCGRCRAFIRHLDQAITTFHGLQSTTMNAGEAESLSARIVHRAGDPGSAKES